MTSANAGLSAGVAYHVGQHLAAMGADGTLASLLLASRQIYRMLQPTLYRQIVIQSERNMRLLLQITAALNEALAFEPDLIQVRGSDPVADQPILEDAKGRRKKRTLKRFKMIRRIIWLAPAWPSEVLCAEIRRLEHVGVVANLTPNLQSFLFRGALSFKPTDSDCLRTFFNTLSRFIQPRTVCSDSNDITATSSHFIMALSFLSTRSLESPNPVQMVNFHNCTTYEAGVHGCPTRIYFSPTLSRISFEEAADMLTHYALHYRNDPEYTLKIQPCRTSSELYGYLDLVDWEKKGLATATQAEKVDRLHAEAVRYLEHCVIFVPGSERPRPGSCRNIFDPVQHFPRPEKGERCEDCGSCLTSDALPQLSGYPWTFDARSGDKTVRDRLRSIGRKIRTTFKRTA